MAINTDCLFHFPHTKDTVINQLWPDKPEELKCLQTNVLTATTPFQVKFTSYTGIVLFETFNQAICPIEHFPFR